MMPNIIDILNKVDHIFQEGDFHQSEFLSEVLQNDPARFYFFNLLSAHFTKDWFIYLNNLGAFDLKLIPKAKKEILEDGKETYWFFGWDAAPYLKQAAESNCKEKDDEINVILLDIIDKYIDYSNEKKEEPSRNYRPDWFICDYIFLLPLDDINSKHLGFVEEFGLKSFSNISHDLLTTFFDRVVSEKHKDLVLYILNLVYTEDDSNNSDLLYIKSKVDDYSVKEFVESSSKKLFQVLGLEIISWLTDQVNSLNKKHPYSFSKFTIVSIDEDEQNWSSEGLNHLIIRQLRNCLDLDNIQADELKDVVNKYLNENITILKRIAIYLIDKKFDLFNNIFWQINNPLQDFECKLEVFKLLKNRSNKFKHEEIRKVISWIDDLQFDPDIVERKENKEKYLAYKKLEWYAALDNVNSKSKSIVIEKKQPLLEVVSEEPSHPGYDTWHETKFGGDYGSKRIIDLNIVEAVEVLENKEKWSGYDEWGLQEDFRRLVLNKTNEAVNNIEIFINLDYNLLYYLFNALREAVDANKNLNWNKVLSFIEILLKKSEIWNFETEKANDKSGVLGMIAWMIGEGSKTANSAFVTSINSNKAIEILCLIEQNYTRQFSYLNQNKDKPFDIINSTRGKVYEALLTMSLSLAANRDSNEEKWQENIKKIFNNRLTDGSFFDELYWTLGFYTPQVSYLDKKWLDNNKDLIYVLNDKIEDYSFKGYLHYSSRLYTDLFAILYKFYERAIVTAKDEKEYPSRLIEHILIAFNMKNELGIQLLEVVFQKEKPFHLKQIVEAINRKLISIDQERLVILWERLLAILKKDDSKTSRGIAFATLQFLELISALDDKVLKLLNEAISNYESNPGIYRLIDSATRFIEDYPEKGGKLLLKLISKVNGSYGLNQRKLMSVIKFLYIKNQLSIADEICISLVEKGNYYAKDIYNEHHLSPKVEND